jgi:AraC-like DNA-binding protein
MTERLVVDLRPLGISEVPMLGRYDHREARPGLPVHAHPRTMEICYLAKGEQLYRAGQHDYVLRGGDLFVTRPGEAHSTGETPQEKGRLYWLQLILPRSRGEFLCFAPREGWAIVQQLLRMPHRHFAGDRSMPRVLDEVFAACPRVADPLQRVVLQNRLVEFLLRVIACAQQEPRAGVSPEISGLLRYIEANIHQTLPLPALAARLELSLPRFKARFKQEVGIPPAEYVLRCKLNAARKRLAEPGASVTDVALELNFSSSQYFATVFRRYTGTTPRSFAATRGGTQD